MPEMTRYIKMWDIFSRIWKHLSVVGYFVSFEFVIKNILMVYAYLFITTEQSNPESNNDHTSYIISLWTKSTPIDTHLSEHCYIAKNQSGFICKIVIRLKVNKYSDTIIYFRSSWVELSYIQDSLEVNGIKWSTHCKISCTSVSESETLKLQYQNSAWSNGLIKWSYCMSDLIGVEFRFEVVDIFFFIGGKIVKTFCE